MPGRAITDQQVKLYMNERREGATQQSSAAKAGISERSGRRIEQGRERSSERHWRTRADPLEGVWSKELVGLLEEHPQLSPMTLLEYVQERYPGEYPDSVLRTLQRRVKQWRALHGQGKAVMFTQRHEPGEQGLSDFTELKGVTVRVGGEVLKHLLYHFRLVYSGWCYVKVVLGGESFTALAEGLQEALWRLGGVPQEHRTDSLSAAYRNIDADQAGRFDAIVRNDVCPLRDACEPEQPGESHENGAIESPHGHLKRRISQALALRGDGEFDSVQAYQRWLEESVVSKVNRRCQGALEAEAALFAGTAAASHTRLHRVCRAGC